MEFYNSLSDADKKMVDTIAEANKLDKELVAIAHKSGAPKAIPYLKTAIKNAVSTAVEAAVKKAAQGEKALTPEEHKARLEADIKDLQVKYEAAIKDNNIRQQVSYKNALQRKVNDFKAMQ